MALWNINYTYEQTAYNFSYYFVQTFNNNPYDLLPVFLPNTFMTHNNNTLVSSAEILNYLVLSSNIKNIDIPANSLNFQPSVNGSILINLYGTYQQSGLFSLSGGYKKITITLLIVPDVYANYYLQNLIIKTKEHDNIFTNFNMKF
jgi:hypothetical protein